MKRNAKRVICLFLATIIVVTPVEYAPPSFALTAISNSNTEEALLALASPSEAEEIVAEVATPSEAESPGDNATPSEDKKIGNGNVDSEPTNPEPANPEPIEREKREAEEFVNAPVIPVIDSTVKPVVPDTGGTFTVNSNNPLEVTYIKPDGSAAKNEWVGDGKDWYHVDESGNLNFDWYLEGERTWYKLNIEPGDRFGAALVGWNYEPMDDKRYFFDPSTTKMLTYGYLADENRFWKNK